MWKRCVRCEGRYRTEVARCPLDGAALVALDDPQLGRVFAGRYRVLERIGAGAMGAVYRAEHAAAGREFALKVLDASLAGDAVQRRRFLGEAQAANLLRHPNIVEIYDAGVDGDAPYLAMELLRGEALDARLQRAPMPLATSLRVAAEIARALAHAHAAGVVHRDVKPGNVFLCAPDGRVKLLDLGVAHMRRDDPLTRTGQMLGTPAYLSPEQARGEPVSPASDLYALGVLLFRMITGRLPFQGDVVTVVIAHAQRPPPPLPPEVAPAALAALVGQLLAKAPAARPTALSLAEALAAERARLPDGDAALTPPEPAAMAAWRARRATFEAALGAAHGDDPPPAAGSWMGALDAALARGDLDAVARAAEGLTLHLGAFPAARALLFEETAATAPLTLGRRPRPQETEPPASEAMGQETRSPASGDASCASGRRSS